jgi:hypothetical protein
LFSWEGKHKCFFLSCGTEIHFSIKKISSRWLHKISDRERGMLFIDYYMTFSILAMVSERDSHIKLKKIWKYMSNITLIWRTLIGFSAYDPSEQLLLTMGSISSYNLNEGNYTCVIYTLKRLSKYISIWYDRFNSVMWYRGFKTRSRFVLDQHP